MHEKVDMFIHLIHVTDSNTVLFAAQGLLVNLHLLCRFDDSIFYFLSVSCQMSHAAVSTLCRSIKLQCELYSSRQIAICLDPYCGLGFVLWCLSR